MRSRIFKSFRFEIILYSLMSLFLTIITLSALYFSIYIIFNIMNSSQKSAEALKVEAINNTLRYSTNEDSATLNNRLVQNSELNQKSLNKEKTPSISFFIFTIIMTLILSLILFICFFLLFTKKFVVYLDQITEGISEISAGNFNTKISLKSDNEFAFLADKLNHMADDIKQIMEENQKNENTKNELITSVAHDLRTPLTSIIGYLELVSDEKKLTGEVQHRYIEIAYNKSKRLEKLIEDLFAYTKFTFGEVTMEQTEIDMVKLLEQLVDEFYPSFQDSKLDYDFKTSLPTAVVMADGNLLARAFANLISNAIKYGKDGKSVILKLVKESDRFIITVTNYGKLIPQKDLEFIFDRFYRVESSRSCETGGTGLGLAIAKSIIQMHGGTICARSDFDGTVFEVILDAKKEGSNYEKDAE